MPFGAPGADWLLLGPDVQLQHCDYDLERAAERIRGSGYPQAHDFAANNVLKPPSKTKMLELFTASGDRRSAVEDVLWAVVNRKEFLYCH